MEKLRLSVVMSSLCFPKDCSIEHVTRTFVRTLGYGVTTVSLSKWPARMRTGKKRDKALRQVLTIYEGPSKQPLRLSDLSTVQIISLASKVLAVFCVSTVNQPPRNIYEGLLA